MGVAKFVRSINISIDATIPCTRNPASQPRRGFDLLIFSRTFQELSNDRGN